MDRHWSCLREQPPPPGPEPSRGGGGPASSSGCPDGPDPGPARDVHAGLARGLSITEISRTLRLDRKTVRSYTGAATPDQLVLRTPGSPGWLLDPHLPCLRQRWDEGCGSTEQLHEKLCGRGYRGSLRTLRRLTARLRQDTAVPWHQHRPPPKVAGWILIPPGKLPDDRRAALAQITGRCEELAATRALVRDFADMLCHRHGQDLEAWASQARDSPASELRGFAKGLRKGWAASHRRTRHALHLRHCRKPSQPHHSVESGLSSLPGIFLRPDGQHDGGSFATFSEPFEPQARVEESVHQLGQRVMGGTDLGAHSLVCPGWRGTGPWPHPAAPPGTRHVCVGHHRDNRLQGVVSNRQPLSVGLRDGKAAAGAPQHPGGEVDAGRGPAQLADLGGVDTGAAPDLQAGARCPLRGGRAGRGRGRGGCRLVPGPPSVARRGTLLRTSLRCRRILRRAPSALSFVAACQVARASPEPMGLPADRQAARRRLLAPSALAFNAAAACRACDHAGSGPSRAVMLRGGAQHALRVEAPRQPLPLLAVPEECRSAES